MTSVIQIAEGNYRTVDSNSLILASSGLGAIDEYVPPTNPDDINRKSGRKLSVFNTNSLHSIEVDARSSVKADSASTMSEILDMISKE